MLKTEFDARGWVRLPAAQDISDWVQAARPLAEAAVVAPENAHWMQCAGTWFVGVDALDNAPEGDVPGAPFPRSVQSVLNGLGLPVRPMHRAQVSVIYPGYPKPREGESEAAFRYRLNRDAAHVDGLLPVGPDRRRKLQEPHAYVLGLPLTAASAQASPMVVWEGSQEVMRRAFTAVFADVPAADWPETDVTEVYHAARSEVFETCSRVVVHAAPGEAYLLHRLALHGVAPWTDPRTDRAAARAIAYFRPELDGPLTEWLHKP